MKTARWVAGVSLLLCANAFAGLYEGLTPEQQRIVQNGQQVVLLEEVGGSAWPKVTVYQRLDATPEEAAAVFSDFENQKRYMPDMKKSTITSRPDRASAIVDYRISVLIVSVDYTLLNRVSAYDNFGSFGVDWNFIKGAKVKDIRGNARFEALGTGVLVRYEALVIPDTGSAAEYRERVIRGVKNSMTALKNQVQKERSTQRELLEQQKQALRSAVGRE